MLKHQKVVDTLVAVGLHFLEADTMAVLELRRQEVDRMAVLVQMA